MHFEILLQVAIIGDHPVLKQVQRFINQRLHKNI
uniref:Uncharacterized protein n=1 Tax=Arundo donax TaxID=35708 RepID=A0A0A9AM90_ARUDO